MNTLVLLVALLFPAGPALSLPDKVQGDPGAFIRVPATTDCKAVKWVVLDPGLNLFPVDLLKDTKTAVVTAPNAGNFRILAYAAAGDIPTDPVICTVVIGTPAPPGPPTPPPPTDPFSQALQAAYAQEKDVNKAKYAAWAATVYQGMAGKIGTPNGPTTVGQLFAALHTALLDPTWGVPRGSLPLMFKVIEDDSARLFGTDPAVLLNVGPAQAALNKYAIALGGLK